ncbi:bactofilin family protein [Robbsia andropogonis]|uniref:bactofilin family protein n=1 Tax=Robbsia andropogonis TaxID=28092 RepID=UPI0020A1F77E|nr:polymer-forming cytoskeletal protein [Robbsia andropogonis]MCP1121505.1 polymer-forming cytoskeletal protein [Robbsia andropogonis]MCP1131325.1 polymer-forming cytoskeletal protein [Robbsia andropogonis]
MAIKEDVVSLLSVGIDLDGNLVLDHGISVFGIVRGTIISSVGLLHIGETGRVTGNLDGEHVRVDGTVQGDIRARESIEVNGRVDGTIFYSGTIRLGPHAVIDGQLKRVGRDVLVNPVGVSPEPSNVASLAAVR